MFFYRSQGKEKEAETLLKDSIRFGPHFADAYSSLASLYAEQVRHQVNIESIVCFIQTHTCTVMYHVLILCLKGCFNPPLSIPLYFVLPQKRFDEANEVYLNGIENCPDSSDLHNNYGVFLVDTGEFSLSSF